MKNALFSSRRLTILAVAALTLCTAGGGNAQPPAPDENFPGIKKALTPEQYANTGLSKLSPEERAKLDDYLRGYFSGATQRVVQQATARAVDNAVKERRVEPPQLIESKIVGRLSGWQPDKVFVLENGQAWKVVDDVTRNFATVENPDVFIVRDFFGYRMAVAGCGTVRVKRVK